LASRFQQSLDDAASRGYVESWDAASFPEFDRAQPRFLDESVELSIDGQVLRGQLRVAKAIVDSWVADNPRQILIDMAEWISENQSADDEDRDWQRRWHDRLAEKPMIVEALRSKGGGAERLFDRAKLPLSQRLAMRFFLKGRSGREAATELKIDESTYRERVEKGLDAIRGLSFGIAL